MFMWDIIPDMAALAGFLRIAGSEVLAVCAMDAGPIVRAVVMGGLGPCDAFGRGVASCWVLHALGRYDTSWALADAFGVGLAPDFGRTSSLGGDGGEGAEPVVRGLAENRPGAAAFFVCTCAALRGCKATWAGPTVGGCGEDAERDFPTYGTKACELVRARDDERSAAFAGLFTSCRFLEELLATNDDGVISFDVVEFSVTRSVSLSEVSARESARAACWGARSRSTRVVAFDVRMVVLA